MLANIQHYHDVLNGRVDPREILLAYCFMCKEGCWNKSVESNLDPAFSFCSKGCCYEFEQKHGHDYE